VRLRVGLLAVLYCVPFTITTTILYGVQSEIQGFKSIIRVEKGDAAGQSIRASVYTGIMMLLTILMSFFI
jgi:hypothetical protein